MSDSYPFLDFFAGSGLVTKALRGQFHAVWANDKCAKKKSVYVANHGGEYFRDGGIEDFSGADLPEALLSWASFPCQDLSLAGKQEGIKAGRSGLVWHWLRIIKEMKVRGKKPPIVVAENVVGLISGKGGAYYRVLHEALTDLGYKVGPIVLNAERWLPQSRSRVFVIGVPKSLRIKGLYGKFPNWAHTNNVIRALKGLNDAVLWRLPEPEPRQTRLSDLIQENAPCDPEEKARHNISLIPNKHMTRLREALNNGLRAAPGYKRIRNNKQVLELRFDDIAGCLRTPCGGSSRQFLVIPREKKIDTRLLTVREAARLMGADDYILPGVDDDRRIPGGYNDGYKAMGDAVAVPAVNYLSGHILKKIADRICSNG